MSSPQLYELFCNTRRISAALTHNLSAEDQLLQSMPEASPIKWHLAHTTWFFDTFILKPHGCAVARDATLEYLFNSYYNQVGAQYPRVQRGLISRPSLEEVWQYRRSLEEALTHQWENLTPAELELIELGIHHEQQHQELMLTDIKHAFSLNPQFPALVAPHMESSRTVPPLRWLEFPAGDYWIGCDQGFGFDNEKPHHRVYLDGFHMANRPVTNGEFLAFIEDGGYSDPHHWLSEGWAWVQATQARSPLYWQRINNEWFIYTLAGLAPLDPGEPVCHINYLEASAFASWAGKRLPTEYEWEAAAQTVTCIGQLLDLRVLHPRCASTSEGLSQMFGDVWEWTRSAYLPYPGYRAPAGAVGEYNGKFMVNQWVLRGGSCATPEGHIRASYRNFFPVHAGWQFSGVRLADDLR